MTEIHLRAFEVLHAVTVGGARHNAAIGQARRDAVPVDSRWQAHIVGALGELTVAKVLGVYWAPNVGGYDYGGDVAGYQVRATPRDDGPLVIRPRDPDDAVFVLVTGEPPCLHVRGCIRAGDAKQDRYRQAPGGRPAAWFVPAVDLDPWP